MRQLKFGKRSRFLSLKSRGSETGNEAESQTRWAISYADFLTLLLAFFLASYFSLARAKPAPAAAQRTMRQVSVVKPRQSAADSLELEIRDWVKATKLEREVMVRKTPRGEVVSLSENLLFPSGEAALTVSARRALVGFGRIIRTSPFRVQVEGYTDDVPISNPEYPSNWHLGAARATTVLYYLVKDEHVPPSKISAASYGETRPLVPNDTREHRAENRRVDIVFLDSVFGPVAGGGFGFAEP